MSDKLSEAYSQNFIVRLLQELRSSKLYSDLQHAAQTEVAKPSLRLTDLKRNVQAGLINSGYDRKLRNAIYKYLQTHPRNSQQSSNAPVEHTKEPLAYLRKAQLNWEKRILKSLNSMCTELSIPLARKRPDREQKDMALRWTELGADSPDLSQIRPVYAPKDFLEVVISLQNANHQTAESRCFQMWGIIQIPIKVKELNQLRIQYSDMSINQCQSGVDDCNEVPPELFDSDRMKLGRKVLTNNHSPLAQEYVKKGCPISLRGELWKQILGIEIDDIDTLYYSQLKSSVLQHDLLVDSLLYKDIKLTATNDDQYFVFEDFLYQVLFPFSRDTKILQHFSHNSASPPKSYIKGKLGVEDYSVVYPPNGVIPFHGFAMYISPLCYIYGEPIILYYVFRELYTRYFFRLHSLSSHPQGIVGLSLLFEKLLQTHEPELFFHLKSVGCQPLKIAFKWLMRAFSGYLSADQVLLLWDRILAHNSLEILPVLAVAIFSFRKTNLLRVASYAAAEAVLADLTTLEVIPLIQLCLFTE